VSPWIIFIATTNSLFLGNQADLDYDLNHYLPFVYAFVATVAAGLGILILARAKPGFRPLVWSFYLLGLCFFVFTETSHNHNLSVNHGQWVAFLLVITGWLVDLLRNTNPAKIIPFFALYAVFLIATDSHRFVRDYESGMADKQVAAENEELTAPMDQRSTAKEFRDGMAGSARHNIYHFVLDGYQSDLFPMTLDEPARRELKGFTVFPNNVTISGRTDISIPAVFRGKNREINSSVQEFTAEAMSSDNSLLYVLKKAGYSTTAYLRKGFTFEPNLFDQMHYHHNAARHRDLEDDVFRDLWIYRFLPRFVSTRLLDEETVTEIVHRSLSPKSYAVVSYDAFINFVKREPDLAETNRYTFAHLLLPHHPYVLDCECTYQEATEPLEQFCCATRVIVTLVRLLKDLGRFRESLIVIQGDHGLGLVQQDDGKLRASLLESADIGWHRLRAKTLLLIKPAGVDADNKLSESDAQTTLLDITPTIYRSLEIDPPPDFQSHALFPTSSYVVSPVRYYHYYRGHWEEEVSRYEIVGDTFAFDRILRPTGFYDQLPAIALSTIVEAEDGLLTSPDPAVIASDQPGTSGQHLMQAGIHLKVHLAQPGAYYLKARMIVPDDKSRLEVSANDGNYDKWMPHPCIDWEWQATPFQWELEAGEHILGIRQIGSLLLDQIEVTPVPTD
jgi:hypothetical protein